MEYQFAAIIVGLFDAILILLAGRSPTVARPLTVRAVDTVTIVEKRFPEQQPHHGQITATTKNSSNDDNDDINAHQITRVAAQFEVMSRDNHVDSIIWGWLQDYFVRKDESVLGRLAQDPGMVNEALDACAVAAANIAHRMKHLASRPKCFPLDDLTVVWIDRVNFC